jgi:hypothetical protein
MKKVAPILSSSLVVALILLLLLVGGCQKNSKKDDKTAVLIISKIALNHLQVEVLLAQEDCEEKGLEPCKKAEDLKRWVTMINTFEALLTTDDQVIGLEQVLNEIDVIAFEMISGKVDKRTLLYLKDIRTIVEILLKSAQESSDEVRSGDTE